MLGEFGTEQNEGSIFTNFDYPDIEIDGTYGTFQNQYEQHKSELIKYPEFEHLANEDITPKSDSEGFYPEMLYESKLKE